MKVLVTGGNGFVGRALIGHLAATTDWQVATSVRQADWNAPAGVERFVLDGLNKNTDWTEALKGVDCVVHTAARVHVMRERREDASKAYREVNVEATKRLASQMVRAGARRIVYLSSIKVNGESTEPGKPFDSSSAAMPIGEYARSKYDAELALRSLAEESGLEVVIVRPPLVYGPGVGANFRSLMSLVSKRVPLPVGAIDNHRSLVALENLVDLLACCCSHPAAANQLFLVSDGEDFSTGELVHRIGEALEIPARVFSVPVMFLKMAAALLGKRQQLQRLTDSLQVDIDNARKILGWRPVVESRYALRTTAMDFLRNLNSR